MTKLILGAAFLFIFAGVGIGQSPTLIDELTSTTSCEDMLVRVDMASNLLKASPDARLFLVYYEGKHTAVHFDKNGKRLTKVVNPRRLQGWSRVKEMHIRLTKSHRIPSSRVLIVNGGYRENFVVEFWQGTDKPVLTPTLERKDINFRRGKSKVVNCAQHL